MSGFNSVFEVDAHNNIILNNLHTYSKLTCDLIAICYLKSIYENVFNTFSCYNLMHDLVR